MTQGSSLDSILITVVLATLAVGLPVFFVLAIRFLWERHLGLGRSKDFDKLIWQLHRIASAMEHQMNLSFPAVQPGTEEARDLAYLQSPAVPTAPPPAPTRMAAAASAAPVRPAQPVVQQVAPQQPAPLQPIPLPSASAQPPVSPSPATPPETTAAPEPAPTSEAEPAFTPLVPHDPAAGPPRHAGVNSMFGF